MIGGTLNIKHVRAHWDETLGLATSIKQGTVMASLMLWNTIYLERAAHGLRSNGHAVDDALLQYLSPLGWEHINLTGDYLWRRQRSRPERAPCR